MESIYCCSEFQRLWQASSLTKQLQHMGAVEGRSTKHPCRRKSRSCPLSTQNASPGKEEVPSSQHIYSPFLSHGTVQILRFAILFSNRGQTYNSVKINVYFFQQVQLAALISSWTHSAPVVSGDIYTQHQSNVLLSCFHYRFLFK